MAGDCPIDCSPAPAFSIVAEIRRVSLAGLRRNARLELTNSTIKDKIQRIVNLKKPDMLEHTTSLSKEGRILIPAAIRNELDLNAGEALTLSVVNGEVRITRRLNAIRSMQKRLARLRDPKHPAVESLLRERRAAAARE
ncbi:MAG: AbrB/MazE/SpoVT family DNA-binding domain-containing protein [Rudaea sp.]|uniref:AbrB/MazE/SpoVT family DNA-binding domain-containing protein n=1 Tax=Rudaea sp. TaxID=2136325 RepID=UPI0039E6EC08